jgi:hypothetical protein
MLFFVATVVVLVLLSSAVIQAQDPAEGWMAYAVGSMPTNYERITKLEMTWSVGEAPKHSRAFFSPWFGMDPADNLNLIQPVNPWSGTAWSMYTEYFQWSPTRNSNSKQYSVEPGQTLRGSLIYVASEDSYVLNQTIVETGKSSSQTVACQDGKKFTVPYVVYEKTFPCSDYGKDEKVTFRDIVIECDNKDCTNEIKWDTSFVDDNCNFRASVDSDKNEISITWDTTMKSVYDSYTYDELMLKNKRGWGSKFVR